MKECQTREQCIHVICRFPILCKKWNKLTPLEIAKKSGYPIFSKKIRKKDIVDELKKDENIITTWIDFTADKRWTPAWGISKENDEYSLFYMSSSAEVELKLNFRDPYEACALLIRMELEGLDKK